VNASRARDFDLIIIGGGVSGVALAALLVARHVCSSERVAVVADRAAVAPAPDADWDLRVFALSRASQRLLQAAAIWDRLPPQRVSAYERMCVWDAQGAPDGAGSLQFDCAQIGEPNLGHIVEGRALQWQCWQAARSAGVALLEGSLNSIAIDDEQVTVRLEDGRELRAKLLVAADGTDSKSRELLQIGSAGHSYHQDALVAHVRTSRPHQNTAWQRFLNTGPLAFLPLSDGRSSIVWSASRSRAAELRAMDTEELGAAITSASGEALGQCVVTTPVASFPLKLQYALEYVRPRIALLGDAAHVVHPLAGQGLNLGLLDCATLTEVLSESGGAVNFGDYSVLRRYERWRRSENLLAAGALDGLERLFTNAGPVSAGLRVAGLNAVSKLPFLKQGFARRALGLAGDVPEFLRGDPISPRR
jgi:2-polyprenylphenol 6-hydroxylase